jgi:hypothetical protein
MAISSVVRQHQNPYALAQPGAGQACATAANTKSVEAMSTTATTHSPEPVNLQTDAKSIMAKYDLTHITYGDMEKLGRELVAAGALPENKLLDFIPIDLSRIKEDGTIGEPNNKPVNMIEQQQGIVSSIKAFGGKGADYANMVLNLYKNFQTLHDQAAPHG